MTRTINLLLIGIITILIAVIIGLTYSNTLEKPGTCSLCHQMGPYVSSYLEPASGSIILKHEIGCIDCHTNTTTSKARSSLFFGINVYFINEITGLKLNTSSKNLGVNCPRCHIVDNDFHLKSTKNSSCVECHWAHNPLISEYSVKNTTATNITYGPHRNQTCQNCHGTDFKIPRCTNCHSGHDEQKINNELCLGCHLDPHIPEIPGKFPKYLKSFKGELPFETCKPCHENEYFEVAYSSSRHTQMQTCTLCHDVHGKIRQCNSCHPVMQKKQHPDFGCGNCHKTYEKGNIVSCFDCHGRKVHDLSASDAFWNPK